MPPTTGTDFPEFLCQRFRRLHTKKLRQLTPRASGHRTSPAEASAEAVSQTLNQTAKCTLTGTTSRPIVKCAHIWSTLADMHQSPAATTTRVLGPTWYCDITLNMSQRPDDVTTQSLTDLGLRSDRRRVQVQHRNPMVCRRRSAAACKNACPGTTLSAKRLAGAHLFLVCRRYSATVPLAVTRFPGVFFTCVQAANSEFCNSQH